MKKLLSLLGAVAIGASSASVVVSCSYAPSIDSAVQRETDFYSQVSAEALKSGVLADQSLSIGNQEGVGIDTDFSSSYLSSKEIIQSFRNLYGKDQGAMPDASSEVSSLYDTVFGNNQGGYKYTVADSYSSLLASDGINKKSNLYKIATGQKGNTLVKPDSSTAGTINLVSGLANIVFKNDFDPSMGKTLISLLTSSPAYNAMNGSTVPPIMQKVDAILTTNAAEINKLAGSITQSDIANEAVSSKSTYKDQLTVATNELFEAVIYFASGQKSKFNEKNTAKDTAVTTFWKMTLSSVLKDDSYEHDLLPATADYKTVLVEVTHIVRFAITLLHYMREFDTNKIQNPIDGNHLFSRKTNSQVITDVLNKQYVAFTGKADEKSEDNFWYWDGTNYSTKLNLQNLVSDLAYYFSPSDDTGHQMLKAITIILGGKDDDYGPIAGSVIKPLLSLLSSEQTIANAIKSIPKVGPIIGDKATTIADAILKYGNTAILDLINWFTSDGDNPTSGSAAKLIQDIVGIVSGLNFESFAGSNEKLKGILAIVDAVIEYLNSSNGQLFFEHPWSVIYGHRMFASVGAIMNKVSFDETVLRIGDALQQVGDIRGLLTMPLNSLLNVTSEVIGKSLSLPDMLYSIRNDSISDIIQYLANNWLVYQENPGAPDEIDHSANAYNALTPTGSENKYYTFDSQALSNVLTALTPNSGEKNKPLVSTDQAGTKPVTIFMPLYAAILYYGKNKDLSDSLIPDQYWVTLPGKDPVQVFGKTPFRDKLDSADSDDSPVMTNVSSQAFEYLLGLDDTSDKDKMFFREGSLLMAVSNLYGHWYKDNNETSENIGTNNEPINPNSNASESLFSLLSTVSDLGMKSISNLTRDQYQKYFDPENWRIRNVKQKGLDMILPTAQDTQQLDYDLMFHNPDNDTWFTYHVRMHRQAIEDSSNVGSGDTGWIVDQLLRK